MHFNSHTTKTDCLWLEHNCFLLHPPHRHTTLYNISRKNFFLSFFSVDCGAKNSSSILWILKFWSHINGFIHAEWAFHFLYTPCHEFEMESGRRKKKRESESGIFDKWVSLIESSLYSRICAIFFFFFSCFFLYSTTRHCLRGTWMNKKKSPWMSRVTNKT